jgi:hypothetical protein
MYNIIVRNGGATALQKGRAYAQAYHPRIARGRRWRHESGEEHQEGGRGRLLKEMNSAVDS